MTRTILDIGDQVAVLATGWTRANVIHDFTNCIDQIDIPSLAVSTDVVSLTDNSRFQHDV